MKKIIIFTLFFSFSLFILSCDKIPSTKEASKRTLLPSLFPRDNINTLPPAFHGEWHNILGSDVTMYVSDQDGKISHYGIYNGYIYVKDLSADHAGKPTALFEKANSFAVFQANSFILYVLAKGNSIEQVRTAALSFPHRKIVGIKQGQQMTEEQQAIFVSSQSEIGEKAREELAGDWGLYGNYCGIRFSATSNTVQNIELQETGLQNGDKKLEFVESGKEYGTITEILYYYSDNTYGFIIASKDGDGSNNDICTEWQIKADGGLYSYCYGQWDRVFVRPEDVWIQRAKEVKKEEKQLAAKGDQEYYQNPQFLAGPEMLEKSVVECLIGIDEEKARLNAKDNKSLWEQQQQVALRNFSLPKHLEKEHFALNQMDFYYFGNSQYKKDLKLTAAKVRKILVNNYGKPESRIEKAIQQSHDKAKVRQQTKK